ncbi:hypothetical protein ABIE51_001412 [Lysobacter sp. OAE881]|uniref:YqaJ viral recombinase family protein n=1 Tax=Lysobacter sp. OAE881 TaxID=2663813 RepID=UPI00178A712E
MKFYDVEQNSPEWDELRLGKATASNFACFMANYGKAFGEPAKDYALQIALEIATGRKAEHSFTNKHMERGHAQEPLARMLYEEMNFVDVLNGGFFCHGTHGDSPDGRVEPDGVTEFKAVTAPVHYATIRRGSYDPAYKWQLVGHLDCTGRQWVDFGSFCSDFPEDKQLVVYRLNRNDCLTELAQLRERREQFLALVQETYNRIKD